MRVKILLLMGIALLAALGWPCSAQAPVGTLQCQTLANQNRGIDCLEKRAAPLLVCDHPRSAAEDAFCRKYGLTNKQDTQTPLLGNTGNPPSAESTADPATLSVTNPNQPLGSDSGRNSIMMIFLVAIGALALAIAFITVPKFRRSCVSMGCAVFCFWLAYAILPPIGHSTSYQRKYMH
jgi:hypothetical protein